MEILGIDIGGSALKGAPVVALLCYYTIVGLVVFQPFRKKQEVA